MNAQLGLLYILTGFSGLMAFIVALIGTMEIVDDSYTPPSKWCKVIGFFLFWVGAFLLFYGLLARKLGQ